MTTIQQRDAQSVLTAIDDLLPQIRERAQATEDRRRLLDETVQELDEAGLLLDFKLLKQVMRPVVEYLDHQMINELEPFITVNPSAENLARYFYTETAKQLREMTSGRVRVKDCTLYETDTSFARYYE